MSNTSIGWKLIIIIIIIYCFAKAALKVQKYYQILLNFCCTALRFEYFKCCT